MEEHKEVFLLIKDKEGEKSTNVVVGTIFRISPCNILRGALAIRIPEKHSKSGPPHNYQTVFTDQLATFYDSIDDSAVAPLLGNQAPLLAGVVSYDERYQLFVKGKLEWGTSLKLNDPVLVSLKHLQPADTGATPRAMGVIHYVGPVKGENGIRFGIEITDPHYYGQGTTDGDINGERYFHCNDGNGMFVSFDKLSEIPPGYQVPGPSPPTTRQPQTQMAQTRSKKKQYRFKLGDRVVVFKNDGSPVGGTVRWVGRYLLQNQKKQDYSVFAVGIETDIKITGSDIESCLPTKHHFFTVGKKKGTLFMREEEVMLEADFLGQPQQEILYPQHSPSPHPPRQQQSELIEKIEKEKQEKDVRQALNIPPDQSLVRGQQRMFDQFKQDSQKNTRRHQDHFYDNPTLPQSSTGRRHINPAGHYSTKPTAEPASFPPPLGYYPPLQDYHRPSHAPPMLHSQIESTGQYSAYNHSSQTSPLVVCSRVVLINDHNRHGVIRWMGPISGIQDTIAGVELDAPMEGCGDGEWNGIRYFTCYPGRGFFCPVTSLRPDSRYSLASYNPIQLAPSGRAGNPVQRYKESKGVPIERAVREAGLLITDLQETGKTLGTGSYGAVVEVEVRGKRCAAKKLHGVFTAQDVPAKEKKAMAERFETECRRVLYIKHTNIIEMIGIHFHPVTGYPTLVMELMDISLRKYLETNPETSVPLRTKYSILHDVANGLLYLHTLPPPLGPMVHRDLTANNILLTLERGVVAKIADLGQAKRDSANATRQQTLSQVPGNDDHMPPEAWMDNPEYDTALDIFSFGVVMLHILTHQWPKPLAKFKTAMMVRTEVERRQPLLDKISSSSLKSLVVQCLGQEPRDRPSTMDVYQSLKDRDNPMYDLSQWEELDHHMQPNQIIKYLGDGKGIQGHQNSCYLDATIFGLFALSDVFDSLFILPCNTPLKEEVKLLLWKGIVNPLRKNGAVKYDSVMSLRNKLEELGKMEKVNTAEKDPEEFLNMLFKHILHVDPPFIRIKRPFGTEPEFFVQLFVEFDASIKIPTIDKLMSKMFREQQIYLAEVPSKLLVQVPRYGREFQAYKRIIPGLKFNTSSFLENPYKCFFCNEPAHVDCPDCGKFFYLNNSHLCDHCSSLAHKHPARRNHHHTKCRIEAAVELELLSVLCIETSHYVCFSRDSEERWIFFDSMADRVYDQYNIPKGVDCTEILKWWVYEGDQERLMSANPRELPELVRRFTQDVYMCVYIQPDYGMYG